MADTEIYNFLNSTITNLRDNYNRTGRRASGNWGDQLESRVEENQTGLSMKILGLRYTEWITPDGRGPNRNKSVDSAKKLFPIVLRWMNQKGMQEDKQFAFRIALKWVYKGIRVPNQFNKGDVVSNVINQDWVKEGIKIAGGSLITTISSDVINRFKLSR